MAHSLTDDEAARLRAEVLSAGLEATAKQLELNTTTGPDKPEILHVLFRSTATATCSNTASMAAEGFWTSTVTRSMSGKVLSTAAATASAAASIR